MKRNLLWCNVAILLTGVAGCSSGKGLSDNTDNSAGTDSDSVSDSNQDTVPDSTSNTDTNDPCEPPDMLIVADHTLSMALQPSGNATPQDQHELSKWSLAIDAIETITAEYEERLRFGLELFPRDPGDGTCVTLAEKIDGKSATNTQCEQGQVIVPAALNSADEIAFALDPETTLLCISTPIGKAINTASTYLASIQEPIRSQYVLVLTDGRDTCDTPDPVERVQALSAAGVFTFVVGFDGSGKGIDASTLNNMACAGKMATGFQANCTDSGGGAYVAADPEGTTLFLAASSGQELKTKLESVAALVGCDDVI